MKIQKHLFLPVLIAIISLTSCVSQNELNRKLYFSDSVDLAKVSSVRSFEPVIEIGDRLSVQVMALNAESAIPYNYQAPAIGLEQGGYEVRKDGTIELPQLGKIPVAGKTRPYLVDTLTSVYTRYLNNPLVNVQFLNFKVTVLGQVSRPGQLNIPDGKLNILEAVAMVGDIGLEARKDNVLVVREKDGVRSFGRVNLNEHNVYNSPYFHLKQNDLVYVETEKKTIALDRATSTRQIVQIVATSLGIIISLALLITR